MSLPDNGWTDAALFTLVRGGDVYSPRHLGPQTLVLAGERIVWLGLDEALPGEVRRLGSWCREVDASDWLVLPGLIDPHQDTIGAGGEQGYTSRTAEVSAEELLSRGITTSIGCLGTYVATRHLTSLRAKTRQLDAQGVTAYMLTGGFTMPPRTITGSVEDDLRIVDKVIGVGEIAISDRRACDPCLVDLARLVTQARRGASLSVKSGVTLFHVGDGKRRLQPLEALLDQHDIAPNSIVADHVNRTPEHVEEAVRLARRGAHVCMDTVDGPFPEWIQHYRATGGPADKLSVCSDAHTAGGDVANFAAALFDSARDGTLLDELLLAFTANTADVWQLPRKGRVQSDAMRTCYWSPPTL